MSARCRPVHLEAEDAVELAELLEFLADWIAHNAGRADRCLIPLVSWSSGYTAADLAADLRRFAFLLGGSDPRLVYGPDPEEGDER